MYLGTSPSIPGTLILSGNNWGATYSVTASLQPGVTNYLLVLGYNSGGPGSFIGDFTLNTTNFHFANGTQFLVTNPTDWFVSATDYNVGPNVATSYGFNGVGPWGYRGGIDASAQWIWTTDFSATYAYLSAPIYSAVPLPSALLLLARALPVLRQ